MNGPQSRVRTSPLLSSRDAPGGDIHTRDVRPRLAVRRLGCVPYYEALDLQRTLHAQADRDYLLFMEHPQIYTLGRQGSYQDILLPPAQVGADLAKTDRGGRVTYHGPGQMIGYPILTLAPGSQGIRDVVRYLRCLEGVLIAALADLGITANRVRGLTGVWVAGAKIASIGVRVSAGRTMHGFSLNVDPDLGMFSHIVPCGIRECHVTSVRRVLNSPVDAEVVTERVVARFCSVMGYSLEQIEDA